MRWMQQSNLCFIIQLLLLHSTVQCQWVLVLEKFQTKSLSSSSLLALCGDHRWPVRLSHLLHEENDITLIRGPAEAWGCPPAASLLLQSCSNCYPDLSNIVWQASDWQQQEESSRHRYVWVFFCLFACF